MKTPYQYFYVFCHTGLTGKDDLDLPKNSFVCNGEKKSRKLQIRKIMKNFNPNFVIINGYVGNEQVETIRLCREYGIPYAIESDTPLHIPRNRVIAIMKYIYLHYLLSHKKCYGFPGGTIQKQNLLYYGVSQRRITIMPMSVSITRLKSIQKNLPRKNEMKNNHLLNKTVFLFVGRLEKEKNVGGLIDAFSKVKQIKNDTALLIVGDGSLRSELEKKVKDNNIDDVFFEGYIVFPEIVSYYQIADFLILPSVYEPWGLVVNEAMALGVPVIISSEVGCREDLVSHGDNGFIFESGNNEDLQNKMISAYMSDYRFLSNNCKDRIKRWNYSYYLNQFLGVIENVRKTTC